MRKIILQGLNLDDILDIENIEIIKSAQINEYLNNPHTINEWFINSHGNICTSENSSSQLILDLFQNINELNFSDNFAHNILSKITKNNLNNKPSIVHIFSCHSGAAQYNLQEIEGDIVLCTYSPAANFSLATVDSNLFQKYNNSNNLIEFILDNLPLLSAVNFTVSYKLNNVIQTLTFDHSNIHTMNLKSFAEYLQTQYNKVKAFYNFQLQSYPEYSLLFSEVTASKTKQYNDNKLIEGFNTILKLYSHKFSTSEILELFKVDNLNTENMLDCVIKHGTVEIAKLIIDNIRFDKQYLISIIEKAVEFNKAEIAELIINNVQFEDYKLNVLLPKIIKFEDEKLCNTELDKIKLDDLPITKMICNKIEETYNSIFKKVLSYCIPNLREEVVNLLLPKIKCIDSDTLINVLFNFLNIPDSIDENIKESNLRAVKLLWNRLDDNEKINYNLLSNIVNKHNSQFNKFLFSDHNHEGSIEFLLVKHRINSTLTNEIIKYLKLEESISKNIIQSELNEIDNVTVMGEDI